MNGTVRADLRANLQRGAVLALLLFAVFQLSGAAIIKAKAWLAPVLVETAWHRTLERGVLGQRPWPWADTWPVARLSVPAQGVEQYVLAGDAGSVLAFGPGHSPFSAAPGTPGTAVISAHRDTHFAFLKDLVPGSMIEMELPSGEQHWYRVGETRVVDSRTETLDAIALRQAASGERLLLVTCYPFQSLVAGGPLRYVVTAQRDTRQPASRRAETPVLLL